mmetsp:Transcript_135816/g.378495  ORF Transcript_135816/g.378495 Transcript_135816/m.378495 type:complete len:242 (+) Transcript_135816:322-1047(+)
MEEDGLWVEVRTGGLGRSLQSNGGVGPAGHQQGRGEICAGRGAELMLQALSIRFQCSLADVVGKVPWGHGDTLLRPRVHDEARRTALLHRRNEGLATVDRPPCVHVNGPAPLIQRCQCATANDLNAGVVHEEMDRARDCEGRVPQRLQCQWVCHINGQRHNIGRRTSECLDLRQRRLQILLVDVRHEDLHADLGTVPRCRTADARGRTRDHRNAALSKNLAKAACGHGWREAIHAGPQQNA